jgi:hypothetical protein
MAALSVQAISIAGIVPAYSAASGGGDTFVPSDRTYLHVKNGGGSPITVTVVTPGEAAPGVPIADPSVSVSNGSEKILGPFYAGLYQDSTGTASITYSGVTSVTVGAFRLGT